MGRLVHRYCERRFCPGIAGTHSPRLCLCRALFLLPPAPFPSSWLSLCRVSCVVCVVVHYCVLVLLCVRMCMRACYFLFYSMLLFFVVGGGVAARLPGLGGAVRGHEVRDPSGARAAEAPDQPERLEGAKRVRGRRSFVCALLVCSAPRRRVLACYLFCAVLPG